jgi:hypothetical protein
MNETFLGIASNWDVRLTWPAASLDDSGISPATECGTSTRMGAGTSGTGIVRLAMKLSDYRGKVVVLFLREITRRLVPPDQLPRVIVEQFRRLGQVFEARPVALLAVVPSHGDEYKKAIDEQHVPLRVCLDPKKNDGLSPIRTAWYALGPDCYYAIDRDGVIRYKLDSGLEDLQKAVSVLLNDRAERDGSQRGSRVAIQGAS